MQQGSLLPDDSLDAARLALQAAAWGSPGHYDELLGRRNDPGALRPGLAPAWARFFDATGVDGWQDLNERARLVERRVQDDGATYNVFTRVGRGANAVRAWPLDLLPMLIGPEDWAEIEAGVAQRARLLNMVLQDVYGDQTLLDEGLLPAALIFGHPNYLRPMHRVTPAAGVWLHVAAFDIARAPDGYWQVLSQRIQAPSGLGYSLESRLIVSQMFPEAFRELHVQRLAASFRNLLESLMRMSPAGPKARVALLTPGPLSETYFEQVFLARYLGITLVESGDLSVRGDALYLKTLHGLDRVDVLLRRVDDEYLDPLELRADSHLGVPGLLQAMRAGGVIVANAPGAGFLESPGLAAFWPAVSQHLLGEELLMPAATTWWCGERTVWSRLRDRLEDFVVAPTFPSSDVTTSFEPQIVAELPPSARERLRRQIDADPAAYTLQAPSMPSEQPVWRHGRLEPRAAVVRVFALAQLDADGRLEWRVLPGGMTRVEAEREGGGSDPWLSMQHGSASVDTWVMTSGPVDGSTLLPPPLSPADLSSWHRSVTSRAAENLFWLGRYTERSENVVRLATEVLDTLASNRPELYPALDRLARGNSLVGQAVPSPMQSQRLFERALVHALGDANGAYSLAFNLRSLETCAATLRERLSPEHWKLIQEAGRHFTQHLAMAVHRGGHMQASDVLGLLHRAGTHLAAVTGAQTDRMTRDDGWRLLSVGRQIERLSFLCDVLVTAFEMGLHESDDGFALVLDLFDSTITYRAQFQARREVPPLLHLLISDTDNPRSLAWVARTMRDRLSKLARHDAQWVAEVTAPLPRPETWDLEALCHMDEAGQHSQLLAVLNECMGKAQWLSDQLSRRLFSHVGEIERMVWQ